MDLKKIHQATIEEAIRLRSKVGRDNQDWKELCRGARAIEKKLHARSTHHAPRE